MVADGQTIARHDRCYGRSEQILDPIHYLVTLGRRPAALDHTNVYRHWQLPPAFAQLRERLEQCHGSLPGARQYVRVLQLLAEHPVQRVQQAIEHCGDAKDPHAEWIIQRAHHLAELASKQTQTRDAAPSDAGDIEDVLLTVQVPLSGLSHFDQFLSRQGEPVYA